MLIIGSGSVISSIFAANIIHPLPNRISAFVYREIAKEESDARAAKTGSAGFLGPLAPGGKGSFKAKLITDRDHHKGHRSLRSADRNLVPF